MSRRSSMQPVARSVREERPRREPIDPQRAQRLVLPRAGVRPATGDVLALQRTVGNRAVGRLLDRAPAAVQRLDVDERPVQAERPKLTNIRQLVGGHKGDVYLIENEAAQKLVVKFQNEAPKEAILGTMFMEKAGANTPRVRTAEQADSIKLLSGLSKLLPGAGAVIKLFLEAGSKFTHTLLMDYAQGQTIKHVMETKPSRLAKALKDKQFQFDLGRVLAADALAGNPDRAMAVHKGKEVRGWYHEQNLFINKAQGTWGNYAAVAIDNAFSPTLTKVTKPFGMWSAYGQLGSVAAASSEHFATEAGLIFDRLLLELGKKHPNDRAVAALVEDLRAYRAEFVDNVGRTAEIVMTKTIGEHKQGWKAQLGAGGASADEIKDFRHRKRYMRLIRLGCDPVAAHDVAADDKQYQKYILIHEKGKSRLKTYFILKRGKKAYHKAKYS